MDPTQQFDMLIHIVAHCHLLTDYPDFQRYFQDSGVVNGCHHEKEGVGCHEKTGYLERGATRFKDTIFNKCGTGYLALIFVNTKAIHMTLNATVLPRHNGGNCKRFAGAEDVMSDEEQLQLILQK